MKTKNLKMIILSLVMVLSFSACEEVEDTEKDDLGYVMNDMHNII